jgi:hypothetical protein
MMGLCVLVAELYLTQYFVKIVELAIINTHHGELTSRLSDSIDDVSEMLRRMANDVRNMKQ